MSTNEPPPPGAQAPTLRSLTFSPTASPLLGRCDISASQFLVTSYDFTDESRRAHLEYSLEQIIEHGMVRPASPRVRGPERMPPFCPRASCPLPPCTVHLTRHVTQVPIINENDAVSGNQGYTKENVFSDNDALASIVASQMGAEV